MFDTLTGIFDILIGFGLTTVLILFKWYLEDNWFVKKDFSYEEKEKEEENDYGYIE